MKFPPAAINRYNRLALVMPDSGSLNETAMLMLVPGSAVTLVLLLTTGLEESVTVKVEALVAVKEFTVTEIVPVFAPTGTVVVMLVVVDAVTVAAVPLNITVLLAGVALKLVPVMVTVVPSGPLTGLKLVIVGGGITVKIEELVAGLRIHCN